MLVRYENLRCQKAGSKFRKAATRHLRNKENPPHPNPSLSRTPRTFNA